MLFQLTRPMRGVTTKDYKMIMRSIFQLTRPMRGVTPSAELSNNSLAVFQLTRPMRGVTRFGSKRSVFVAFQLTRPMRGVTVLPLPINGSRIISTHTPHAGRDIRAQSTM